VAEWSVLIFLDRIDRLAAIMMNEWLPYYQYWAGSERKEPAWLQEMNFQAHQLWDCGLVTHTGTHKYEVYEIKYVYFRLPNAKLDKKNST
jgi:hypothetical protein